MNPQGELSTSKAAQDTDLGNNSKKTYIFVLLSNQVLQSKEEYTQTYAKIFQSFQIKVIHKYMLCMYMVVIQ